MCFSLSLVASARELRKQCGEASVSLSLALSSDSCSPSRDLGPDPAFPLPSSCPGSPQPAEPPLVLLRQELERRLLEIRIRIRDAGRAYLGLTAFVGELEQLSRSFLERAEPHGCSGDDPHRLALSSLISSIRS